MVIKLLKLNRTGVENWLLIRVSGIIIFFYTIYILNFILTNELNYIIWRNFFSYFTTKIFTIFTFFSILIHSYIGLGQILTDYIKSITLQLLLYFFLIFILITYSIYVIKILWEI